MTQLEIIKLSEVVKAAARKSERNPKYGITGCVGIRRESSALVKLLQPAL